jgi:predicted metal-dependent HD superfamily phosphohydrolase
MVVPSELRASKLRASKLRASKLRAQWIADGGTDAVLDRVVARYSEAHRRYHGLDHVIAVVQRVDVLMADHPELTTHAADVRLAAWFHDVVYDPRSNENEAKSADLAADELRRFGVPPDRVARVHRLVLMTAGHHVTDDDERILADADLWTLGGPADQYSAYGNLIRQEYSHVPEEQWKAGRSAFIEKFLTRPRIFATRRGLIERETSARENLANEALFLTSPDEIRGQK